MADLTTILFDFDGTLVRTRDASWEIFKKTNDKFGLGIDSSSAFFAMFDQNFYVALDEACVAHDKEAREVREHFQRLLSSGYTPDLVPGMAAVVRALAGHYTLIVISSNTMETVRRILQMNDLAHCFAHVFSGDLGPSKHETIRRFLGDPSYTSGRRCTPNYEESALPRLHDPDEAMLISDTVGDIEEARSAGIRAVGVTWGMHRAEDLERSGAEFVCIWPEELVAYLRPGAVCASGSCSFPLANSIQEPSIQLGGNGVQPARPSPAIARRERRVQSASRLDRHLNPKSDAGAQCDCGCATAPAGSHQANRTEPPPVDPILHSVLTTLFSSATDRLVRPR